MILPRDINIKILSYIDNNTIKNICMPYNHYKQYLIQRQIVKKKEIWYRGVYNNLYNRCFICHKDLNNLINIMIICFHCELILDEYCNYPLICLDCMDHPKIKRGKVYAAKCPTCDDCRMHVGITRFS